MNSPLASVIIPVFNTDRFLRACLNSICRQTFDQYEIICVDDGSTDQSSEILEEFAVKYPQLKVIRQINQGRSIARNLGLQKARGKYIYFMDSDDYVELDLLWNMVTAAEQTQADMVMCGMTSENEHGLCDEHHSKYFTPPSPGLHHISIPLIKKLPWEVCSKLFRRSVIQENSISFTKNIFMGEDGPFSWIYMIHTQNIFFLQKGLYHYVTHESSTMATSTKGEKSIKSAFSMMDSIKDFFQKLHKSGIWNNDTEELFLHFFNIYLEIVQKKISPTSSSTFHSEQKNEGDFEEETRKTNYIKYLKYKILSIIMTGKKRKHYTRKLKN